MCQHNEINAYIRPRTLDTLIGYLPIFQMLPKTSLCIRYHWLTILLKRTLDVERIKVIIKQADPYNKTGDATKGGRGCKI